MVVLSILLITGCQSLVKTALLNAKSYPTLVDKTAQLKQEFNIQEQQFCDTQLACYAYYFAPNKGDKKKLSMNINAHFTDKKYASSLLIQRQDVPTFSGSVVIIHGFRGSKDWSLLSAAYWQFLGFDVYIFDLLGHGDLSTPKGFGVKDSQYIQRFIEQNLDSSKAIIAVGNSMGGLVATTLANKGVVSAAFLQAPMTQFDQSLLGYFKDTKPWYGFLLSANTLQQGANKALQEVGLSRAQTNTIDQLKVSTAPFLIFASNTDSVSPYSVFKPLQSSNIQVLEINNVEHAYMSMIGQFEHEHIVQWLKATTAHN